MTVPKRRSVTRALTLPISILLLWQTAGWIAFGLLEPTIAQRTSEAANSGLILTVAMVTAALTTALALFALYYRRITFQGDVGPNYQAAHKCLNCGHDVAFGTKNCPYCGSKTLF